MRNLMQAFDKYGAEAGIEPARPYERGILSHLPHRQPTKAFER